MTKHRWLAGWGVLGLVLVTSSLACRSVAADTKTEARAHAKMAKLPLLFEPNAGQWDERVRFVTRAGGAMLLITDDGMTFGLRKVKRHGAHKRALADAKTATVHMHLVGGKKAIPRGEEELVTKSNYFLGNDRSKWRANVPTYGHVRAHDALVGVDVVWHGGDNGFEYDLAVAAGVDAEKIELAIEGATKLNVTKDGALEMITAAGTLVQHPPQVVQAGRSMPARYVRTARDRVRFAIDGYDRRVAVLIDPTFSYSTYLGGSGNDGGYAIAVDSAGNAYVTGYTESTNFPTQGPQQAARGGGTDDLFVSKLNAAGSALVYSTYLGGSGDDFGQGIAVDSSGNALVTGYTTSTNFPTQSPLQATNGGGNDGFVSKLNATGSALLYSTYLGGSGLDQGFGIAVDGTGNAYVTGQTGSANFPKQSALQATKGGGTDGFVSKLNAAGSALTYSTYLGSSGDESGCGIAVDASGNAYVTGYTASTTFPTQGPLQATNGGGSYDGFVSKLNAAGSALTYSTYLGGSGLDQGFGIAVDGAGNAYVTGRTVSTNFPTKSPLQASHAANVSPDDVFVSKLNVAGSALVYSTYLGGSGDDEGYGIAVDGSGNASVAGRTTSTDFPTQSPLQGAAGGLTDVFVSKLNATGSALMYSTYLGGGDDDYGYGIALDGSGNAYVTGSAASTNFPTKNSLQSPPSGMLSDSFVSKIMTALGDSCAAGGECLSGYCADGACCASACNSGGCDRCDLTPGTCIIAPVASAGANPMCSLPYACDGVSAICPSACTSDAQCATAYYCAPGGTCQPRKAQGAACSSQSDCKVAGCRTCASGNCVDGYCCDTACNGLCQSCASATKQDASANGACGNAKDGTNPHADNCPVDPPASCGHDGKCGGSGACRLYTPPGVSCGAVMCVGNTVTGQICDGAGMCEASAVGVACSPFLCSNAGCTTSCLVSSDCATDGWCNGGVCEKKRGLGVTCPAAEACTSAFCVDGYCCNGLCTDQCEACDVAGVEGSCAAVTGTPHGARLACNTGLAGDPCSTALCDGNDRTQCGGFVGSAVACDAASCSAGTATLEGACNGAGTCKVPAPVPCGAYACGTSACNTSCTVDTDCSLGNACDIATSKCVSGATCDGDHVVTGANGVTQDCAPYKCNSDGTCKPSCLSAADCVTPLACDKNGQCVSPPSSGTRGCDMAAGTSHRDTAWLLVVLGLWIFRRRRRASTVDR